MVHHCINNLFDNKVWFLDSFRTFSGHKQAGRNPGTAQRPAPEPILSFPGNCHEGPSQGSQSLSRLARYDDDGPWVKKNIQKRGPSKTPGLVKGKIEDPNDQGDWPQTAVLCQALLFGQCMRCSSTRYHKSHKHVDICFGPRVAQRRRQLYGTSKEGRGPCTAKIPPKDATSEEETLSFG